jgi:hypothetical protein
LKGDDVAASWVKAARLMAGAPAWVEALSRGLVSLPGFDLLEGIFRGTIAGGLTPVKVGRAGGYVTGKRSAVNGLWGIRFGRPSHTLDFNFSRRGGHI